MTTAVNIGRINVWPTYDDARDAALEADTVACEAVGQLTVWRTNAQALAHLTSEGGGEGGGTWPPDNAKIAIDLVNVRAWTETDGEVAIDTLLGSDPNTENAWDVTSYDPANLSERGYSKTNPGSSFAFIGTARSLLMSGSTFVVASNTDWGGPTSVQTVFVSADGNNAVEFDTRGSTLEAEGSSWSGTYDQVIPDIVNYTGTENERAHNKLAVTITPTRADFAVNGSDPQTSALTTDDYPVVGDGAIVAALIQTNNNAIETITIYDALPDTTGLSELSEVP